jgi:hypothetical protein
MVLASWKRALLLTVEPPPAITLRVMVKRALLRANVVLVKSRSRKKVFMDGSIIFARRF